MNKFGTMETLSKITVNKAVEAADGFLRLGLPEEAWHELEFLPSALRKSKPVMEARLRVYQALGDWSETAKIARTMTNQSPEETRWWIEWSRALTQQGQPHEARGVLLRAAARHPDNASVNYHLAKLCIAADQREEATRRLKKAFAADPALRAAAKEETDLAQLWEDENRAV